MYRHPSKSWEVTLPAEEVRPELPEPVLGINFVRDGMNHKDWLSLVVVIATLGCFMCLSILKHVLMVMRGKLFSISFPVELYFTPFQHIDAYFNVVEKQ